MAIKKIWDIKNQELTKEQITASYSNRVLAHLMLNRGINTPKKIEQFLNPELIKMSSPDVFTDMEKTAERIKKAVETNENITIYGDFDADGITSTAILYLTLKEIGASVDYYLPDRATESHGLNNKAIINIISKRKTKLIITVDCGISNNSEVNLAKGLRTDVIITDHHEAPEILPDAYSVINPKAPYSLSDDITAEELESINNLSGAGIAFKLACKLLDIYNKKDFVHEILPLCTIGTIGDVVPLLGENRKIVHMGLELLKSGKSKGIQKLLEISGINDKNSFTQEAIAYYVVPRINAAGRLESPLSALNVLISSDEKLTDECVKQLNDFNSLRQSLCDETFMQAKLMYEKNINSNKKSIILFNDNWHIGVIGIVCSKLTELYNKPAFLMTRDANNPNIIRCSCRSIEGLNVHTVLSEHKELYEGFGGHKMAAGFSFDENKIKFEAFKEILSKTIENYSTEIDYNEIKVPVDMELKPNEINLETIELINKLQPYGAMNPEPVFVINHALLKNYKIIGQNNNHLKLTVSKEDNDFECIKWNCSKINASQNEEIDILFNLRVNEFNGNKIIQLILNDLKYEKEEQKSEKEIKILDHRKKKDILAQVLDFISTTKKTTGIFIQNMSLKKELNLSQEADKKVFDMGNIPQNIEQLMFFDCPYSREDFSKIMKETDAKIVHLMNFSINETQSDKFTLKISGMLKYAMTNLNGIIDIRRISNVLNVDTATTECALYILEDCKMIEIEKVSENEYKLNKFTPIEISKIKNDDMFNELETRINEINSYRNFYLNSTIDEIKESLI